MGIYYRFGNRKLTQGVLEIQILPCDQTLVVRNAMSIPGTLCQATSKWIQSDPCYYCPVSYREVRAPTGVRAAHIWFNTDEEEVRYHLGLQCTLLDTTKY